MSPQFERSGNFTFLYALFFLSGTAGLIFQVVWMYRLGLVFGNAAYATAATLSVFFLGLAIGGRFFGNVGARLKRPFRVYGLMELGIALTALLIIPSLDLYEMYYAEVVSFLGGSKSALLLAKFFFGALLLLPPTFLMGGTFPILAQYIGKDRRYLERRGTILYAVNTLGAALGAFFTGFYLIREYGVSSTYGLALILAASVGVLAIVLDKFLVSYSVAPTMAEVKPKPKKNTERSAKLSYTQFAVVAFFSGVLALSAETLWTRMFAQVLQNSVYSFSAILVVFLLALALGGFVAHLLVRSRMPSKSALAILLSVSAILIGVSPNVFNIATSGLGYLAMGASWYAYVWAVFKLAFLVVLPPTVVLGAVFPFLLKVAPMTDKPSGQLVGRLVLFNSMGSFVGPVLSGFVLLDTLGLWGGIKIVAVSYGILAVMASLSFYGRKKIGWALMPIAVIMGILVLKDPPIVRLDADETLLDSWQSSDGVVSIVQVPKNIQMRLDNFYVLGDSGSLLVEQMQAHIPLLIHPAPKKVVFLGMGTGITAGAALHHNVEKVVAVELVSNVIPAAQRYFAPWANGLFNDERVSIVADDARNYLLGTHEQFDVIVGDLFTPWHAGTGSLYTLEHFKEAKKRLSSGGIFAQWLPMYQLTSENFDIIAATFASVFPQVTLWRADFSGTRASIVLIGQEKGTPLDENTLRQNSAHIVRGQGSSTKDDHMAGLFYLGNLDAVRNRLSGIRPNTDDKRSVEFEAPILSQQANAGRAKYVTGTELENFLKELAGNLPPEEDPYLSDLPPDEIRYVKVGSLYQRYIRLMNAGKDKEAKIVLERIQLLAPDFLKKETGSLDD
ncbi:fused MFS/spermidine synthase [Croceitalea sp. MTPC9]|nr:fused MFS/spermidine synthase [Croceitalea sp. MTPC6]GMN17261.1 fused MFS/spermidine synthase [Croceitalea sp. MTPC9]